MTAGVQTSDPAAYLPVPRSASSSASGAKASGESQDFRSELQLQDADPQETKPAKGAEKAPGKSGKKPDTRAQALNLTAVTPVQTAPSPKQNLPLVLDLPKPVEDAPASSGDKAEDKAGVEAQPVEPVAQNLPASASPQIPLKEPANPVDSAQPPVRQAGPARLAKAPQPAKLSKPADSRRAPKFPEPSKPAELPKSVEPQAVDPPKFVPQPEASPQSAALPQTARPEQPATAQQPAELPIPAEPLPVPQPAIAAAPMTLDPTQTQTPMLQVAAELPVPAEAVADHDQPKSSGQFETSDASRPVSPDPLLLADAVAPEPVARTIQEGADSAPPVPAPLAFAARMAAAPQTADPLVPQNASQPATVSAPEAAPRIPVRHPAAAQILPSIAEKPPQGFKRDTDAAPDTAPRTDARPATIVPQLETARVAPSPEPAAPPQAPPTSRPEPVLDPPAAPPSSAHNFSVRVPDNNGGSTQVRFVESGGEVRVSVRTADEGLAQNLRSHLNDLSQRLADGGIPAEIWKPGSDAASSQNNQHQPDRDGRGSNGQPSGGQDGQPDRQQKRPAWLEEMEASLHGPKD